MMDINQKPKIKKHVTSREEEFGLLLFTNRTPILAFNEDSRLIWEKINNKNTVKNICEELCNQGKSNLKETEKSVVDFIESCIKLDLLEF